MTSLLEGTLIVIILTALGVLGSARTFTGIRVVAVQGFAVGLIPLWLLEDAGHLLRSLALFVLSVAVKAFVFPWLLRRALRETPMRQEETPLVSPSVALLLGVGLLGFALWLAGRLTPPVPLPSPLVLPVALFTMLIGLFVICSRNRALSQVLGYLLLENGIYLFGLAIARESPLLIEMGALLDVLFAVLVMGIAIFHISRTFDSIEVDRLSSLKD